MVTCRWMVVILSAALVACQRPDTSRASESTPQIETTAQEAAVRTAAAPRCMVSMPATPPSPAASAANCPVAPEAGPSLPHRQLTFVEAPAEPTIDVEIASDTESQSRGLMYRTELGRSSGMLFSWPDEQVRTFWMHNTCLPLDMLFLAADQIIVGVLEQVPVLNDDARSIPCPAAYVLEVNAGYCRSHGVQPGQHVEISSQ